MARGYLRAINLIDLVIGLAVLVGMANGYRRGLWLSIGQYAGLVGGVVAGAATAPWLLTQLGLQGSAARPVAAVLVLVIAGSAGSSLGYWIGEPIRRRLVGRPSSLELVAGAVVSGLAVLSVGWFLGLTFARGPNSATARLIQRSEILQRLDEIYPRPPSWLAGVERTLAGVGFPQAFAGLERNLPGALPPPASIDTPEVRAAQGAVFRVSGRGCGGEVSGTAYPVARNYLVTNAHVISGTTGTMLTQGGGRRGGLPATVVLFDPERDVAVLYAPGVSAAPLPMGTGSRGTEGAVIGYPGGGAEDVEPAVIDGLTQARGRDIYNDRLVTREIYVLEALVRPGNSGGPLIDLRGHVLGLVFAASSSNGSQAYALTNSEIAGDLKLGTSRTQPVAVPAACAV